MSGKYCPPQGLGGASGKGAGAECPEGKRHSVTWEHPLGMPWDQCPGEGAQDWS